MAKSHKRLGTNDNKGLEIEAGNGIRSRKTTEAKRKMQIRRMATVILGGQV
jgi:hypothetical protein